MSAFRIRPTSPICLLFGHSFDRGYCLTCGRRIGG